MDQLKRYFFGIFKHGARLIVPERSLRSVEKVITSGHASPEEALAIMETSAQGLSEAEAEVRFEKYGKNEIAREKPPAWWVQFARSFINPFIIILFVLAMESFLVDVFFAMPGERSWLRLIILCVMLVMSGSLRFWQELRSTIAAEKLRMLVQNKALVLRKEWGNERRDIAVMGVVPGDIVFVSAGDMIPADMRLLTSQDLFVSQSALTGESMPIEKFAVPIDAAQGAEMEKDKQEKNPLEINTLCFMGTSVVSGSASGIVISTGSETYFGSLARGITEERPMTSFDIGIGSVSKILIYFMLVMVPLVFVLNGITKHDWKEAFFFAVAVAVGLTPEMLPLVVTANLAKGAVKMAKKKVIVKKLNAIQNFGAMDILCTDKTGTITENRVVLMRHLDPHGRESDRVLNIAYLNSFFQTGLKNLMDQAVIEKKMANGGHGVLEYQKFDEIPFDFSRRRMSVVVEDAAKGHMLICKGAVEEVLKLCTNVEYGGAVVPMTERSRNEVHALTRTMNEEGLRVLAVAYRKIVKKKRVYAVGDEEKMTLVGYVGFLDPPKDSAKKALKLLEHHGIKVKIITGDNEVVTKRICKDVGLQEGAILLGNEIEALSDEELARRAETTIIFAKTDPLQKARIIAALRAQGHVVGYMGDGVNDAAAMREADIGVSVDAGVDIAKEAADIILLENDLLVLEEGVVEGRTIFGNIMKYIKMTSSSNFGNVFSVLAASAFLPFLPMLPTHLLIQNLLYDFSQLSIPLDRMDKEFLKKPRKWVAGGIARFMLSMGPVSSLFDIATFAVLWFVLKANVPEMQSLFQSGWFIEGLLSQTLVVHMIRTQKIPFLESRAATPVILSTIVIMGVGIVIPFTTFGASVGFRALPLAYFPLLAGILLGYFGLAQVAKMLYIRTFKEWL